MKVISLVLAVLTLVFWGEAAIAQADEYKRFNEYNMQPEVWHFPGPVEGGVGATGDLSISIPVMNVPGTNGFGFDIAFSYKAGIKLHQQASWIGLGWNFDPASITRDVQGNLRLSNTNYGVDYNSDTHTFDNLPDAYQVTLPGRGTMTMMRTNFASFNEYDDSDFLVPDRGDSSFHFLEYKNYLVDFTLSTSTYDWPGPFGLPYGLQDEGDSDNNDIIRWKVTTDDGVRYYFGMPSLAVYKSYLSGETNTPFYYPNAWRLLAIAGPNCDASESDLYSETAPSGLDSEIDWVKFEYGFDNDSTYAWRATSETNMFMNIYLKKVITPTHEAEFITSGRNDKDLTSTPSGIDLSPYYLKLDTLKLSTRSGTVVKQAVLDTDYELGEYSSGSNNGKLTLKQIKFLGSDGGIMPGYEFLYLDGADNPAWLTAGDENYFRYDGWGYYNDAAGPRVNTDSTKTDARVWSLRKVVFPTGGTEEYDLENDYISTNTVDARVIYDDGSSSVESFDFDSFGGDAVRWQGGVRVKKITRTSGLGDTLDIVYTYGPGIAPTVPLKLIPHWNEADLDILKPNEFHTYQRGTTDIHYQWVKKQYFGTPAHPYSTETTHYLTGHNPNVVIHEQTGMWTLHIDNNDVFGGVPWGTVVKTERVRNTDKDVVEFYHDLSTNRVMTSFIDDIGTSAYDYDIRQMAPRVTKELAYTTYAYSGTFGLKTLVTTDRTYDANTLQVKSEAIYSSSEMKRKDITYAYEIDEYGGTTWNPSSMNSTSVRGLNLLKLPVQTENYYGDLLAPSISETCEEEFPINPDTISVSADGSSSSLSTDTLEFTFQVDQPIIWEAIVVVDETLEVDEFATFKILKESSGATHLSITQTGPGAIDTSGTVFLEAGTYQMIAGASVPGGDKAPTAYGVLEYRPDRHEFPLSLLSANTITYTEENYDNANNWQVERVYKMKTEEDLCTLPGFNEWNSGAGTNGEEWQLAFEVLEYNYGTPSKYEYANGSTLELFYGDNDNNLSNASSHNGLKHALLTGMTLDNTLSREFDYDTTHFVVDTITDENGHSLQFRFDEFGRLIKSLNADTNIVATHEYVFSRSVGDTSISDPNYTRTTLYYSGTDSTASYDYFDGRASKIQSAVRADGYDFYSAQTVDMMGRVFSQYKTYRKSQAGTRPLYDSSYRLREEFGTLASEETDRHITSVYNSWFDENVVSVKYPGEERPDNMNYISRSRVLAEDTLSSFYSAGDDVVWSTVKTTDESGQVRAVFTDEFGKERMRQVYPPGGGAISAYATTVAIDKDVRDTLVFTLNVQQDIYYDYTISTIPFDSPWDGKAVFKVEDINGNVEFADSTEDPDQDIITGSGEISDLAAGTYRMVGQAIANDNCKTESAGTIRLGVNDEISTTYFEYDGLGNISNVYSPNYFDVPIGSARSHWMSVYEYNSLNQLIEKTSPDAGTNQYKYDLSGNLRYSSDANQTLNGLVAYNTYDYDNRPVDFGIADTSFDALDPATTYDFESEDYNLISTNHYDDDNWPNAYPWNRFDTTGIVLNNLKGQLVANLYRIAKAESTLVLANMHYTGTSAESNPNEIETAPDSVVVDNGSSVTFTAGTEITLGSGFDARSGSSFDASIDPALGISDHVWQLTLYSYNNKGQIEKKYIITEGLADSTVLSYSYDRQGLITKHVFEHGTDEYYHWYDYDDRGKLTDVYTATTDSKASLADVAYEHTVGGLISKTKYNEESAGIFGTTVTNTYNIRDWLTDINDVAVTTEKFAAQYEYTPTGNISTATFYQDESGLTGQEKYRYEYDYDFLDRLIDADYSYHNGTTWQTTNAFDVEDITFDAIGNILTLDRRDDSGTLIDELDYSYDATNSRLTQVADNYSATTQDWDAEDVIFEHDANGNVVKITETNHGITDRVVEFEYNERNLPVELHLTDDATDQTIYYRYNSGGQRVYKKVGTSAAEHYLMDGDQNLGVIEEASLKYCNIFAGTLQGRYELSGTKKHFYVKDHLGSIRVVLNAEEAVQETHDYYPFGLLMPNRSSGTVSTKEMFTGKERDAESGLDYFGARYYSPSIARWLTTDPAEEFHSSYVYVDNNPIYYVDPNGMHSFGIGTAALIQIHGYTVAAAFGGVIDENGNLGMELTLSYSPGMMEYGTEHFSGWGIGGSRGWYVKYTTANNILQTVGDGASVGAFAGVGGGGTLEFNSYTDHYWNPQGWMEYNQHSWGVTAGIGGVVGAGMYGVKDYTFMAVLTWEELTFLVGHQLMGSTLTVDEKGELIIITSDNKEIKTGVKFDIDWAVVLDDGSMEDTTVENNQSASKEADDSSNEGQAQPKDKPTTNRVDYDASRQ